jgi:hypothetical protein
VGWIEDFFKDAQDKLRNRTGSTFLPLRGNAELQSTPEAVKKKSSKANSPVL